MAVFSRTESLVPSTRDWRSPTLRGRNALTETKGDRWGPSASISCLERARGRTFSVASTWPRSTRVQGVRVASATLSPAAFNSCTRRSSSEASPGSMAYILTRPLTGAAQAMPAPTSLAATAAAARLSSRSPSSGRTTITRSIPARRKARTSSAPRIRPFRSVDPGTRRE